MSFIDSVSPLSFALLILISGSLFTIFWMLDSITHGKLVKIDISDKELQTHRNILLASVLMEISLVLMYRFPVLMLPLFFAFFLTRTVHEFIDELHWHADRCTPYESTLHLIMWISILSNTAAMFIWGFFTQFKGVENLHPLLYAWAGIVGIAVFFIGLKEWKR